ncbi:MAG: hypothetical protein GF308_19525 [Candidatus Heimdallarchaeota archaeon]|nr:hypothetical protein [Candidatus Heimdallarchaeota archaeon]
MAELKISQRKSTNKEKQSRNLPIAGRSKGSIRTIGEIGRRTAERNCKKKKGKTD